MRKDLYSTFSNNESEVNEQIQWMYLAMANATEPHYDDGIDKQQWSQIANYIELEITKDIAKSKRLSVLRKTQKFTSYVHIYTYTVFFRSDQNQMLNMYSSS